MMIPVSAVHRAASAIYTNGADLSQCDFEDHYHCRFGLSPEVDYYYVEFDTAQDATAFMLRWM